MAVIVEIFCPSREPSCHSRSSVCDSPLLETSIEELHLLGKNMAHIKFDKIFSSDLPRAMATAQIINSENYFSQVVESHAELREWQLGSLEGQKISTITAIYPHQMEALNKYGLPWVVVENPQMVD